MRVLPGHWSRLTAQRTVVGPSDSSSFHRHTRSRTAPASAASASALGTLVLPQGPSATDRRTELLPF